MKGLINEMYHHGAPATPRHRKHIVLQPNLKFCTKIPSCHNRERKLHKMNKMLQRKMVNEFVYIDITNLYYTVLYLYSVSIGVASGTF